MFKKFPTKPPTKTPKNKGQYIRISLITVCFVNWPKTPEIELIKMNKEAEVAIFLGFSIFSKNNINFF